MGTTRHVRALEQDVQRAYADYFRCFQRGEATATAAHFAPPLTRIAGGHAVVLQTTADVEAMLRRIWVRLTANDYSSSVTETQDVTVLDGSTALLRARGTRHDGAGAVIERFDVLYVLVRSDAAGDWRISVLTSIRT